MRAVMQISRRLAYGVRSTPLTRSRVKKRAERSALPTFSTKDYIDENPTCSETVSPEHRGVPRFCACVLRIGPVGRGAPPVNDDELGRLIVVGVLVMLLGFVAGGLTSQPNSAPYPVPSPSPTATRNPNAISCAQWGKQKFTTWADINEDHLYPCTPLIHRGIP